ncbi:MAG: hypothetical protein AB1384_08120 [Actinomycetota bacterium]
MRRELRDEGGFYLVEYILSVTITASILVMGILVWSNIKCNAYESRARDNFEYALSEIRSYWDMTGRKQGSYRGLVASSMNEDSSMARWTETEISMLAIDDTGDLTEENYGTIYIIRDKDAPADEIGVATFSETGRVYYAHFKQAEQDVSSELMLQAFLILVKENYQTKTSLAQTPNINT